MARQIKEKDCENGKIQRERKSSEKQQHLPDEGNFCKQTNERSYYNGQVPTMDKFVKFWAGT